MCCLHAMRCRIQVLPPCDHCALCILCDYGDQWPTSTQRNPLGVISPQEIMTGWKLDFKKDCRVPFGAYIEASTDTIATKDMSLRTRGSLSLGPAENLQGLLKCFVLETGQVRRSFKVLPMPNRVVKLANRWGKTS